MRETVNPEEFVQNDKQYFESFESFIESSLIISKVPTDDFMVYRADIEKNVVFDKYQIKIVSFSIIDEKFITYIIDIVDKDLSEIKDFLKAHREHIENRFSKEDRDKGDEYNNVWNTDLDRYEKIIEHTMTMNLPVFFVNNAYDKHVIVHVAMQRKGYYVKWLIKYKNEEELNHIHNLLNKAIEYNKNLWDVFNVV